MLVLRRHKEVCRFRSEQHLSVFVKTKLFQDFIQAFLLSYLQPAEKYKVARQIEIYCRTRQHTEIPCIWKDYRSYTFDTSYKLFLWII